MRKTKTKQHSGVEWRRIVLLETNHHKFTLFACSDLICDDIRLKSCLMCLAIEIKPGLDEAYFRATAEVFSNYQLKILSVPHNT